MRGSFVLVVLALVLGGCAKEDKDATPEAATPSLRWVANVKVGMDLGTKLWDANRVDATLNCFQLAENPSDPAQKTLVASTESCPKDTLTSSSFAQYDFHEYIDVDNLGKPTHLFILYSQYLPVGLVEETPEGLILKDLCTLDDLYRSSCSLKFGDNKIVGLTLNPAAAQTRVAREMKLQQQAQELRKTIADTQGALAKKVGELADSQKLTSEIKKAIATLLIDQQGSLKQLIDVVSQLLEGRADSKGYKARLAETTEEIKKLQAAIEARAVELKPLDDGITAGKAKIEELKKQIAELAAKRADLQGADLEKLLIDLGKVAGELTDEESRLKVAIAEREQSDVFRADNHDRKLLAKAKHSNGLLQGLVDLGVEILIKARSSVTEHDAVMGVLKENKVPDAVSGLKKLSQDFELMAEKMDRLKALALQLKGN